MRSRSARAASIILLAVTVAGCGAMSAATPEMPAAPPAAALDGTAWVLTGLPGRALTGRATPTLQFAQGRVSGTDGCNRYSGGYAQQGGGLEIGPLASTRMACEEEVMQQGRAVTDALAGARSFRIDGGTLELLAADGTVLARFAAQSTAIAGTRWTAHGVNNGRGAVTGLVADSTLTLEFGADGRASGNAGCNRFTTTYTVDRDQLSFGNTAVTRRMCADEGVMQQEQAYLAALAQVRVQRMEGGELELRAEDGALQAIFRRTPE
jgi:heat shock protein HslJ